MAPRRDVISLAGNSQYPPCPLLRLAKGGNRDFAGFGSMSGLPQAGDEVGCYAVGMRRSGRIKIKAQQYQVPDCSGRINNFRLSPSSNLVERRMTARGKGGK